MNKLHRRELEVILGAAGGFKPSGAFIAGGAVTSAFSNQPIADVDFYFKSKEKFYEAIEMAYEDGFWAITASDRSITFAQKEIVIQLIYFEYFDTAEAVFDAFDFTCCMGAFDIDADEFVFHPNFLKHVAQKHLQFHSGTRFPIASLLRVHKYQEKGYRIGKSDLTRIAIATRSVKLESWKDLARAVGGQYGEAVLELADVQGEFSLESAMKLLGSGKVFMHRQGQERMPGTWEEMLDFIEAMQANPFIKYDDFWREWHKKNNPKQFFW